MNESINQSLHQGLQTGYIIKHNDIRVADIGTLQEPHLFHITGGQRNNESLQFHCKIHETFHTLGVNKVNKKL